MPTARALCPVLLAACACPRPPQTAATIEPPAPVPPIAVADERPAPWPPTANADPDPARPADLAAAPSPPVTTERTPRFSPDGRHLVYVSDADGPALWIREIGTDAPALKVAAVPGRFRRPELSADGASVLFTTDTRGDEAFNVMRLVIATGAIEEVAAGGGLRRDAAFPVAGGRVVFTARPMTEPGIVVHDLAPGDSAPRRLFADPAGSLLAARADGAQVLVARAPLDDVLFAVDLPSGERRRLYPAEGAPAVRIMGVTYAPRGDRVYVAADVGTTGTHVLALDARTGRTLADFTEPGGGAVINGLSASPTVVAFIADRGTHHELRILDARTLRPRPQVTLPLGSSVPGAVHPNQTHGLALSPDGARVAVEWSTPSSPPSIHLVDTRTGALTALTHARSAATAIDAAVVRIPSFDGLEIPAIVYGTSGGARRPVVTLIHGGFPYASTARFDPNISALVAAGFAVVEPNVRGSGGFGPVYERADDGALKLAAVRDFRAVGAWIAAQPWADPQKLAVMGGSAGGYYTLMALAHQPDVWRAGVAIVPLYDPSIVLTAMDGDLREFMQHELAPVSEPALLAALSPATYVDRIRAPVLVYGAARDVRTPIAQVDALVRALRGRGRHVEYMRVDLGHSRSDPRTQAELRARVLRFLREQMP